MTDAYPLKPFRVSTAATLCAIMRAYPLATLISGAAGTAQTTLIPLLVEGSSLDDLALIGHLDRNNAHSGALVPGAPLSFLFQGPNAYASPDLYPGPQLPGWLYVVVKSDGVVESLRGEEELRSTLMVSTRTFGAADQVFTLDADDPRIDLFINDIRGFRIRVTAISGTAKLAQDKGIDDSPRARNFLAGLDNGDSGALFDRLLAETL